MPDHTHLKQATNNCFFHWPLVTSKSQISHLNLLLGYSKLKNPAFWLALRFLDHNSRTRFFPTMLFLEKVKKPLTLLCWGKKNIYIWVDKIFAKTLKTFLGLLEPSEPIWNFLKNRYPSLSYFTMSNFMDKNQKKTDNTDILHCRQMKRRTKSNL